MNRNFCAPEFRIQSGGGGDGVMVPRISKAQGMLTLLFYGSYLENH